MSHASLIADRARGIDSDELERLTLQGNEILKLLHEENDRLLALRQREGRGEELQGCLTIGLSSIIVARRIAMLVTMLRTNAGEYERAFHASCR